MTTKPKTLSAPSNQDIIVTDIVLTSFSGSVGCKTATSEFIYLPVLFWDNYWKLDFIMEHMVVQQDYHSTFLSKWNTYSNWYGFDLLCDSDR